MTENNNATILLLNDIKKMLVKNKGSINTEELTLLTEELKNSSATTAEYTAKLKDVIEEARKPIVKNNRFTVDIQLKSIISIFIGMAAIITLLSVKLYYETRPNYDQRDNDIKYRYIKMKGEATPETITELEDLFELNRDNDRIIQMWQNIKDYEETIRQQIIKEEQARRNQLEAEQLDSHAKSIKTR